MTHLISSNHKLYIADPRGQLPRNKIAWAPLVDLSYGSASEHEEPQEEQDYPLQRQAASTEQTAPSTEDASQSRDDDSHSERQQHEDDGQTATMQDVTVRDCVASVHGQDTNLMPELPIRRKWLA